MEIQQRTQGKRRVVLARVGAGETRGKEKKEKATTTKKSCQNQGLNLGPSVRLQKRFPGYKTDALPLSYFGWLLDKRANRGLYIAAPIS